MRESFEVASVKSNDGSTGQRAIIVDPGRFSARNVALIDLIRYAYGFDSLATQSQVTGGPGWVGSSRFDINATANGQPTLAMLKTLLQDRFKVVAHLGSREQAIYALVRNRPTGELGPRIHVSTSACEGPGLPSPRTSSQTDKRCGIRGRPGVYSAEGVNMADLARALANFPVVDRVVVDRTGIDGVFDWNLEWTPSFNAGPTRDGIVANPDSDAGLSLFVALREQLGLRLEAQRGMVEFLIIDHAELPTPD